MASLQQIFTWFSRGLFPTEDQYKQTYSSFWHKSEKINQTQILGLNDALDEKLDREEIINLGVGIKQYAPDVATENDLPLTGNTEGDARAVLADTDVNDRAYLWLWNGSKWGRTVFTTFPSDVATSSDLEVKANKEDLPRVYNSVELDIQNGFYEWNNGNFRPDNGWRSTELNLSIVGREIYVTGLMNNAGTALAVYMDAHNNYVGYEFRGYGENNKYNKQKLTIPNNTKFARITAHYGVNGSTSTSPVLGVYTYDVSPDILTTESAKEEFTTNKDFNELTGTSPSNFEKQTLNKEDGFISPNGSMNNTDASYHRAKFEITNDNRDKLYFTGVQVIQGAVIASYFDELGAFISSELETDGTYTFYDRQKLNVPKNAAYLWISGRKTGNSSKSINSNDFFLEIRKVDNTLFDKANNMTVQQTTDDINKIAELDNTEVFGNLYVRRWYRNWLRIQNNDTIINAITVPIVRDYIGGNFLTGDIKVSIVTSTGYKHVETIPFEQIKKYNELDKTKSYLNDYDYIVKLNDYLFLDKGDWVQITSYCVNETDKLALVVRFKNDDEIESEFFSIIDNAFYQADGNTAISDTNIAKFNNVETNIAWCSYCAIGLLSSKKAKEDIAIIAPTRIYTVCNDSGVTGADVRNSRHYSAMLQLDHFLTGLKKEPIDLRFDNGQDRLLFYSPIMSTSYGDAPTYNNNQNILKQKRPISIGGGVYNEHKFEVEHVSVKNSITKNQTPLILDIGDSITVGEGDPPNVYHLLAKELFFMDWVDNGKVGSEFDAKFLGHSKSSKSVTYKGETTTISSFYEGATGLASTDSNIFFDKILNKYTLKNWLAKYRTMDNNGNRLASDSPLIGTDVTNVNAYDVCVPNNILFALAANDAIIYDWLGNVKKFIADIKAEYIAENWGMVNIGIAHPDSGGTYFPSLHPELSEDMYYWNTDSEGRHSRFWKFANDWLSDGTYNEDIDRVFYVPFMFTSPCDVAKNRPVILPDGESIHVPFGWGATTHVYEKAYRHWGYQLYSWVKYAMSL